MLLYSQYLQWGAMGSDGHFLVVVYGENIRGTLYGDFKGIKVRAQVVALARAAFKFRCAIAGGNDSLQKLRVCVERRCTKIKTRNSTDALPSVAPPPTDAISATSKMISFTIFIRSHIGG